MAYPNEDRDPARGFSPNTQPPAPQRPSGATVPYEPYVASPPPASPAAQAINDLPMQAAQATINAVGGANVRGASQPVAGPVNPAAAAAAIIEKKKAAAMGFQPGVVAPRPAPTVGQMAGQVGNAAASGVQGLQAAGAALMPDTAAVLRGSGDESSAAIAAGNLPQAAGAVVRGTAALVPAIAHDVFAAPVNATINAAKGFYSGLTGGDSPLAQANAASAPAAAAAAPTVPVAPANANPLDARLKAGQATPAGGVPAAAAGTSAPMGPPGTGVPGAPGVVKTVGADGRTEYSNVGFDSGYANRGAISPQNMAAADALDARYRAETAGQLAAAQPQGELNAPARVFNARPLGFRTADQEPRAGVDLSGLARSQQAALQVQMANNAENNATSRENNTASVGVQRESVQTTAATQGARLGFDREQAVGSRAAQSAQTRQSNAQTQGLEILNAAKLAYQQAQASGDPKAIAAAEGNLRAAQGKYEKDARHLVVAGGTVLDPTTGQAVHQPSMVFNPDTGQFIAPPQQQGNVAAQKTQGITKQEYEALPNGASYIGADGKSYIKRKG